jgi:hypothetical protein
MKVEEAKEQLAKKLENVDWETVSDKQKINFTLQMIVLEKAAMAWVTAASASNSRVSMLVFTMVLALVLALFHVAAGTILVCTAGLQLFMSAITALASSGSKLLHDRAVKDTMEMVTTFKQRMPADDH